MPLAADIQSAAAAVLAAGLDLTYPIPPPQGE